MVRLLLAAWLLWTGWTYLGDLGALASALESAGATTSWPLLGGLRPIAAALYLSAGAFFVGLFLLGGLLSRAMGLASAGLAAAFGAALGWVPLPALALLAGVYLVLRGGGAYTMDASLGRMQRRALLRELERQQRQAPPVGER